MTPFPAVNPGSPELLSFIRLKDFEVSWAGPHPRLDGFCFGSESGELLHTNSDGRPPSEARDKVSPSGEAINGIAFLRHWMAVSTRHEVVVFTLPRGKGSWPLIAEVPVGAHGVIASPNGHHLAALCPSSGEEVIACAARRGGVGAMEFRGEEQRQTLSTLGFAGLDVVDVCPLGFDAPSRGAAAVGKDGTIILFRDVLRDRSPGTVRYGTIEGVAYRLLSARGYLFLLTSAGLYVIEGLIDHFLKGRSEHPVTPVLVVPMEAVDIYPGGDRWVLIVMPDGVLRLDVDLLEHITPATLSRGEIRELRPTPMSPAWSRKELPQSSRPVLAGA
jgi:hypothetical protein